MPIATTVCRILLGLLFTFAGALDLFVTHPPHEPGLAGAFNVIFAQSHWMQFVGFAQFVAGVFLLANRYVPVALIVLAGFLYNSFAFHITMMPTTVFVVVIVTALWAIVSLKYRSLFAPLFGARPALADSPNALPQSAQKRAGS
ncbi:MAG: hypothetical protein M3R44_02850 [Candidatus Eremiobacteraeota bacterium]|nr:hypothetical protein [Candidatus Eremiobacteraeota bacterium]